jgi:hypothetical protein
MNGWLLSGLIVLALIVVVVRRVIGEPVDLRDLWVPPVVLTAIGTWILVRTDGLGAADLAWATGGLMLGFGLGLVRGAFVVVTDDGGLRQRYTWRTFAALVVTLLVAGGYAVLAGRLGMSPGARPVQLSIGVSFLGEALAVTRRCTNVVRRTL